MNLKPNVYPLTIRPPLQLVQLSTRIMSLVYINIKVYLGPRQTSTMEVFRKILDSF